MHVECLKALVDAGFPASLLRRIDFAFGLKHLTAGELARAYYRSLAAQVASHGLVLEEGGLDASDPSPGHRPDRSNPLSRISCCRGITSLMRLAQVKTAGARTVRLILDDEVIRIVPVEKGTPQWVIDASRRCRSGALR